MHIFGAKHNILNHRFGVTLESDISRQGFLLNGNRFCTVNLQIGFLPLFVPFPRFAPFFLRRVLLLDRFHYTRFDLGFALFAFQPIVLIAQLLNLNARISQTGR